MSTEDTSIVAQGKKLEETARYARLCLCILPSDVEEHVHIHGGLLANC